MTEIVQMSMGGKKFYPQTHAQAVLGLNSVGTNLLTGTDKDISITSHTTDGWPAWASIDTGFSFEHGKTYTFSAEAKNSTDKVAEASIRVWESSTNTQVGIYAFLADGERHSVTITIPNDSHDYHLLLYAGHAGIIPGVDITTTYHHPKLEKGPIATDYSLNPLDISTNADVQAKITEQIKANQPDLSGFQKQAIFKTGGFVFSTCPNGTDFGNFLKSNSVPVGFSIIRDNNSNAYMNWRIIKEDSNFIYGLTQDTYHNVYHLEVVNGTYSGYEKIDTSQTMNDSTRIKLQNRNKEMGS